MRLARCADEVTEHGWRSDMEGRLLRVEADTRRWRLAATGLACTLAIVLLSGQSPAVPEDVVIVRDPASAARVQIAVEEGVPSLGLYDRAGMLRAGVSIEVDGPQWNLFAADGQARVVAGQRDGAAFVIVRDADGVPRAAMAVQESGEPSLYLLDAHLNPLFRQPEAPRLP